MLKNTMDTGERWHRKIQTTSGVCESLLTDCFYPMAYWPIVHLEKSTNISKTVRNIMFISNIFIAPQVRSGRAIGVKMIYITVRKRSCGKVMFVHLSVIRFMVGGVHSPGRHPPGLTPPWADIPLGRHTPLNRHHRYETTAGWPLQRTVHILLECIIVHLSFTVFVDLWWVAEPWGGDDQLVKTCEY